MQEWTYRPTNQGGQIEDFLLTMKTDFRDIDFPKLTMSPSEKHAEGARLPAERGRFSRLVSGYGIGMVMPAHVQPGELAAQMSFSAPISLGLFLVFIYVITLIRRIALHPTELSLRGGGVFLLQFALWLHRRPVAGGDGVPLVERGQRGPRGQLRAARRGTSVRAARGRTRPARLPGRASRWRTFTTVTRGSASRCS